MSDLSGKRVTWQDGDITRHGRVLCYFKGKARVRPDGHLTAHELVDLKPSRLQVAAFHELNERAKRRG